MAKAGRPTRPIVHHESPPTLMGVGRTTSSMSPFVVPASFTRSTSYRSTRPGSSSSRQSSSESVSTDTTAASSVVPSTPTQPQEPILQVVYTSSALTRHMSREEISDILQRSRQNNAQRDITGLLLYRDGSFVQFLEGPQHQVNSVYRKIEQDPRHRGIVRILRQTVEKRDFSKWEMAFRDLDMNRKQGHSQGRSASSASSAHDGGATSGSTTESEDEELQDLREGFSELLNVGLKLGDQTDSEIRPDGYGTGRSKLALPKDMSAQMRKLVITFYKLMDRPL
ncbi:hypothetical protein ACQY0O_000180 [Thecaphora frezii]